MNTSMTNNLSLDRKLQWLTPLLLGSLLVVSNQYSLLLFHTLAELFAIIVALIMFVVAWQTYQFSRNHFLMFLGCTYCCVAGLDLLHTLSFKGIEILPDDGGNRSIQLWVATRYVEAAALFISPIFLSKRLRKNIALSVIGAISIFLTTLIITGNFPDAYIEGSGLTQFKIISEFIIIGILVCASVFLWTKRHLLESHILKLILVSYLLTMLAELAFTQYANILSGTMVIGHILKFFSFWLIFVAIVRTTLKEPFHVMARSSSTYDAIPIPTALLDNQGIVQQVNQAAQKELKMELEQIEGKHCHNLFHPDEFEPDQCPVCKAIATGSEIDCLELELPKQGIWREYSISRIKHSSKLAGMVHVFNDVTERKQATIELSISEEKFRQLVENFKSEIFFYQHNTDGVFTYVSPSVKDVLGYEQDEFLTNFDKYFTDNSINLEAEKFTKMSISGEIAPTYELEIFHKNKNKLRLLVRENPVFNAQGKVQAVEGVAYDISKRHKAEMALRESEENFRQLTENINEAFWLQDPIEKKYIYISPAYETICGYSRKELFNNPEFCQKVIHPDDKKIINETIMPFQGKPYDCEFRIITKDNTVRWVREQAFPIMDEQGHVFRIAGTTEDITKQKQAEDFERASQAKSEFLSKMSHELRTPLNAILGFSQVLELDEKSMQPEQIECIHEIHSAGSHLLELINEVLDLSRIEAGKLQLTMEEVNLNDVINESFSLISPLAQQKGVQINCSIENKDAYILRADRMRLKQVLINLLSNAVKYNKTKGTVTFSYQTLPDQRLRINVIDSGHGISTKHLEKLFQPFERLDADKTFEEGTGIGLTLSKHLVELMGGTIGVKSTPDNGSTFWLELDLIHTKPIEIITTSEKSDIQPDMQPAHLGNTDKHTLLYIEDNEANLKLVERIISLNHDINFVGTKLAIEGIEIARRIQPQLILLDINLPDMSGLDVLENLHNDPRTKDIPIVAVSANAMQHDIQNAMDAGFDNYLTKPLDIELFNTTINDYLSREKDNSSK